MRLKCELVPYGKKLGSVATVHVNCGGGEQLVRWLGFTACAQLAQLLGEVSGLYVPQAVMMGDGYVIDVDYVIKELFVNEQTVYVHFGHGPVAYTARWEDRPATPPFEWENGQLVVPGPEDWLANLDLRAYHVEGLIEHEGGEPHGLQHELDATRDVLLQAGGQLQALFTYFATSESSSVQDFERLKISALQRLLLDTRITGSGFREAALEEVMKRAQAAITGKAEDEDAFLSFQEMLIVLIFVAAAKFKPGGEEAKGAVKELHLRVRKLLDEHLLHQFVASLSTRLRAVADMYEPAVLDLTAKGRRQIELTLDSCQQRRPAAMNRRLAFVRMCECLTNWGYLVPNVDVATLGKIFLYSKHRTHAVKTCKMVHTPLDVDYQDFERLLVGVAAHLFQLHKADEDRKAQEAAAAAAANPEPLVPVAEAAAPAEGAEGEGGAAATGGESPTRGGDEFDGEDGRPASPPPPAALTNVTYMKKMLDDIFTAAGAVTEVVPARGAGGRGGLMEEASSTSLFGTSPPY